MSVRSGRAPLLHAQHDRVKVCIGYPNVGHENAYEHEPHRWFTVWAITKLAQNVRGSAFDFVRAAGETQRFNFPCNFSCAFFIRATPALMSSGEAVAKDSRSRAGSAAAA